MKETNTNETAFDALFREELGNAATPVPPGIWEGISASVGSAGGTAAAGSAVKLALWMKAAISAALVSAIALSAYQLNKPEPDAAIPAPIKHSIENKATMPVQEPVNSKEERERVQINKDGQSIKTGEGVLQHQIHMQGHDISSDNIRFEQASPLASDQEPNALEPPQQYQSGSGQVDKPEAASTEQPEDMISETPAAPAPAAKDSSFIEVPNTVTPNGDGINDTYLIRLVNEERVEIVIYNPLSNEILFRTKNKYQGWNCLLPNGDPAPAGGTYVVKVIYKYRGQPEAKPVFSKLTLIR